MLEIRQNCVTRFNSTVVLMPVSKVDSKCFNLSIKVEPFLSLENVGKPNLTPPDFWKEITSSEEAVSK